MTEDRVHHDESCCWPDQHNGTPHRDCPGAMTEDRVPTRAAFLALTHAFATGRSLPAAEVQRLLDDVAAKASEQPAPPLDVERLALALDDEGGAFRDRDNRRAAERILARLGSAATQPPPGEPES